MTISCQHTPMPPAAAEAPTHLWRLAHPDLREPVAQRGGQVALAWRRGCGGGSAGGTMGHDTVGRSGQTDARERPPPVPCRMSRHAERTPRTAQPSPPPPPLPPHAPALVAGFMAPNRRKAGWRGTPCVSPRSDSTSPPPPASSSRPAMRSSACGVGWGGWGAGWVGGKSGGGQVGWGASWVGGKLGEGQVGRGGKLGGGGSWEGGEGRERARGQ